MRHVQKLLGDLVDPYNLSEIKEKTLSLFREPETIAQRKPEILLPCEWQMGEVRTYSDYEAASLTSKVREYYSKRKSEKQEGSSRACSALQEIKKEMI